MIRTTNDVIHSLLFQVSLPSRYWAESLHAATYLINLLPTKAISAPSPHFALFDTTPSYAHLQVFGCPCYPNTSATASHKLAPRSCRCVIFGYSSKHKGYRCLDLSMNRMLVSRHVVFDESSFPFASFGTPPDDLDPPAPSAAQCLHPRHMQPRLHASPSPSWCTSDDIRPPRRSPLASGRRSTTPSPWLVTPVAPARWSLVMLPGSLCTWIVYNSPPPLLPRHCLWS
jgi:hypothetical protein